MTSKLTRISPVQGLLKEAQKKQKKKTLTYNSNVDKVIEKVPHQTLRGHNYVEIFSCFRDCGVYEILIFSFRKQSSKLT